MRVLRTIAEVRAALAQPRRAGAQIGLVPTMGAFHEGHLSLMRRAHAECDLVVVSLFVNPAQFGDARDLERYPRDEARDVELAAAAGVDLLFAPSEREIYPDGFATTVSVRVDPDRLEARDRGRAHFDAVATVVTKLLNIVGPRLAYFGQKDAEQAHVIRRLVRDLDFPVRIEVCPTVRDGDGLALSSRNGLLTAQERERALALSRALAAAQRSVDGGARDAGAIAAQARQLLSESGVEPDYFELVAADTFAPVQRVNGNVVALVAARIGTTRLIDNQPLSTRNLAGS